jgi:hypothetical protein
MALTAEDDAILRQLLQLLDETVPPWGQLVETNDAWLTQPDSQLAADDVGSHPYQLSHSAWHALTISVDHLRCLRAALVCEQGERHANIRLFTNGQASLVRGVIDSAARAVWMLGPDDRETRIARRLRLEYAEIGHSIRMHELVNREPNRTREERQRRIREIAIAAGVPAEEVRQRVNGDQMLREAGEIIDFEADLAEFTWRACSSLAHGDIGGTLGFADREVVARFGDGNVFRFTGSIGVLFLCTRTATVMTNAGFHLYAQRAASPA